MVPKVVYGSQGELVFDGVVQRTVKFHQTLFVGQFMRQVKQQTILEGAFRTCGDIVITLVITTLILLVCTVICQGKQISAPPFLVMSSASLYIPNMK